MRRHVPDRKLGLAARLALGDPDIAQQMRVQFGQSAALTAERQNVQDSRQDGTWATR